MNNKLLQKLVILSFISVPLISSVISTVHLVDLFMLGNPGWMAKTIAVAIELGAIASFMTLSIMGKLNKFFVWSVFIILFIMQIIGNVYFSFNFLTEQIALNPNYVNSFKEMVEFFLDTISARDIKMYISLLIGTVIPLISIFLLKSMTEYLGTDEEVISVKVLDNTNFEETEIKNQSIDFIEPVVNEKSNILEDFVQPIPDKIEEPDMIKPLANNFNTDMITPSFQKIGDEQINTVKNLHPAHSKN